MITRIIKPKETEQVKHLICTDDAKKMVCTIFCDGEVLFYRSIYNAELKQIQAILETFWILYNSLEWEQ